MDNLCSAPAPPAVAALLDRWVPRLPRIASFQLRGRPKLANKKQLVSTRNSPKVIDYFRASGAGWQARMDAVLKDYVRAQA
jgi:uncharacterized protein (DUF4415 family)